MKYHSIKWVLFVLSFVVTAAQLGCSSRKNKPLAIAQDQQVQDSSAFGNDVPPGISDLPEEFPEPSPTALPEPPSKCQIQQSECRSVPIFAGTFQDTDPRSSQDKAYCFERALIWARGCGNPPNVVTTATFTDSLGSVVSQRASVGGCIVNNPSCPNYPEYAGVIYDTWENAHLDLSRCGRRPSDYAPWCAVPPGTTITAAFVDTVGNIFNFSYTMPAPVVPPSPATPIPATPVVDPNQQALNHRVAKVIPGGQTIYVYTETGRSILSPTGRRLVPLDYCTWRTKNGVQNNYLYLGSSDSIAQHGVCGSNHDPRGTVGLLERYGYIDAAQQAGQFPLFYCERANQYTTARLNACPGGTVIQTGLGYVGTK